MGLRFISVVRVMRLPVWYVDGIILKVKEQIS